MPLRGSIERALLKPEPAYRKKITVHTTTSHISTAVNDNAANPPRASGLRIMHTSRWIRLDELLELHQSLTIGRTHQRDVRLYEETVSRRHFKVTRTARDEYALADCGSKNGVWVSRYGAYGQFERVVEPIPLDVGMHIRVGRMSLIAVDADGGAPILARRYSEFILHAYAIYGNAMEVSRRIGRRSQSVILRLVNSIKEAMAS